VSKWVTFHYSFLHGVQDLVEHENREKATRYFQRNYRNYFELAGPFKAKLPCTYGYPHRKFCGMSKAMFNKTYGKNLKGGAN